MAFVFSNEQRMLHELWRKAFTEGKVEVILPTASAAVTLRFALYNAVKPLKLGKVFDEGLLAAANGCSIVVEGEKVTVTSKMESPVFKAIAAALGGARAKVNPTPDLAGEDDFDPPDDLEESLRRIHRALEKPEGAKKPRETPYYKRGG